MMNQNVYIILGDDPRSDEENIYAVYGVYKTLSSAENNKKILEEKNGRWMSYHIEAFELEAFDRSIHESI